MLTIVFIFCCFVFSSIFSQLVPLRFDQAIQRLHEYKKFSPEELIKGVEYRLTREKMTEFISLSNLNNQASVCDQQFNAILQGLSKGEYWAVKTVDAWGKPLPSGVLKGNTFWVGDYDECIHPMYNLPNKSYVPQPFDTQHCTITPKSAQQSTDTMPSLVLGVCVPSSCDREDVISLVHKLFRKTTLTVDKLVCSADPPNGQKGLSNGAIATITILSLLGIVVLLGTIVDLLMPRSDTVANMTAHVNGFDYVANGGTTNPISVNLPPRSRYSLQSLIETTPSALFLAEFSALKTLRRIFCLTQKNDSESFLFINGIRVLSLFCVIIGHAIAFGLAYSSNITDVLVWTRNFAFQLVINAVLSVDTFFVLSGFLTAILFVRQVRKEKKVSLRLMFLYYIHRYIRLTPTFLLMVLVSINLTPYFGDGPIYPSKEGFESPQCRSEYWWTSILYIGNIVKPDYMCLGIAWYLHNDMQFHWIAPLTLVPFALGRKSFGYFIAILYVLVGMGSILTILLYYPDMSGNFLAEGNTADGPSFMDAIYVTPWCRISAYAVGVLTGYCVIEFGRAYRMNRYVKFVITIFVILIGFACIFGTYPDYILPSGLNRSILVAYQTLSRTLWAICIGWLLFLCSTNQGGIVNKILSWPVWSPLAKLNYSCYLVHFTILLIVIYSQRMPMYFQGHAIMHRFVSYIFFSYAAAILVSIFIETPFFIFEKKLFKR